MGENHDDLLHRFLSWVTEQSDKVAFSFLDEQGKVSSSLSYGQLHLKSRGVAAHLRKSGVKVGDRVVLVFPPSLDYIVAFLGCLMAGVIAVPVFPPDPADLNKHVAMFCMIVTSCEAKVALTSASYNYATQLAGIRSFVNSSANAVSWPDLEWIVTDSIKEDSDFDIEKMSGEQVAFLQYTSGSTSEPKGVMISYGNLAHNLTCITKGLAADKSTIVVSWLPQYHDMGLIGSYLGILYCGGSGYYLSPISFVRKPSLWILSISRYRATHMQAPNFAYGLAARKFSCPDGEKIDLSSAKHMINAAEPVEVADMKAFYSAFEQYGLNTGVIYPTYGLAEHTVYVCSNGKQVLKASKRALEVDRRVQIEDSDGDSSVGSSAGGQDFSCLAGCGIPNELPDLQLLIVDPESCEVLREDHVGEIWVNSGSKAQGYWGLPEKTKETFQAKHSGQDEASEGYLRTGDLGFLHKGELFICGRDKDLIIVRGRNHFPQDIERTVEGVATPEGVQAFRKGCSAAFSVQFANTEALVCAAEVTVELAGSLDEAGAAPILDAMMREVSKMHGVAPNVVILLEPRSIPKTTSGKIARQWVKKAYLQHTLKVLFDLSSLSALADEMKASLVSSPGGSKTGSNSGMKTISQADLDAKASIDPTGVAIDTILSIMIEVVADVLQRDRKVIDSSTPLAELGIDSLLGIQLIADLEQRFTVPIPEKLFMDVDTSLATVAASLQNGGVIKPRAMLIPAWLVSSHMGFMRAISLSEWGNEPVASQWIKTNAVLANIDDNSFPESTAFTGQAPPPDARAASIVNLFLSILVILPMAVLAVATVCAAFVSVAVGTSVAAVGIAAATLFLSSKTRLKGMFKNKLAKEIVQVFSHFYSFRMLLAGGVDPAKVSVFISEFQVRDDYLSLACAVLLQLFHGFVAGIPVTQMIPSSYLKMPLFGALLSVLKCQDESSLESELSKGQGVSVISDKRPAAIATPAHIYVRAALKHGAQIVPCYHSQQEQAGSLFYGAFKGAMVTCSVGTPIECPTVAEPSHELVFEFIEKVREEIKNLKKSLDARTKQ